MAQLLLFDRIHYDYVFAGDYCISQVLHCVEELFATSELI